AGGRDCSAPISVRPIAKNPEAQNCQQASEKCPSCRQPGLQHPADTGAHQSNTEPYAPERMAENSFSRCEEYSLCRKVNRSVSGLLNYVEGFEMNPHRVGWVGQAAMRKSIRSEQIAEVIVDDRFRHRENRQ